MNIETPADLRLARWKLGDGRRPLGQKELATRLRMGRHGWQSISKWEQDGSTIPGPVRVAVEYMVRELQLTDDGK